MRLEDYGDTPHRQLCIVIIYREEDSMSKKYAVIYLENSYSLRYSEFDADSVYDAVDNAFEIAYREAVQYDEIMDDLAENRERYESDDRPQGYADYANNLIGYIDDYFELVTLIDKDDHEAIIGECDPFFLK